MVYFFWFLFTPNNSVCNGAGSGVADDDIRCLLLFNKFNLLFLFTPKNSVRNGVGVADDDVLVRLRLRLRLFNFIFSVFLLVFLGNGDGELYSFEDDRCLYIM